MLLLNLKFTNITEIFIYVQDIDYEGFRKFLDTYLEVAAPDDLSRHLFLSFIKKNTRNVDSKAFKVIITFLELNL